jgi:hypothetical protein
MDQCVVLEGQQWFESEARCKARAFEMAGDVNQYMKSHKPVDTNAGSYRGEC